MSKKKYTIFGVIALFIILFVVGLGILLDCVSEGRGVASTVMAQNGGSMDTNEYQIYIRESITTYRLLGLTLLSGGIVGVIVFVRSFIYVE